MTSREPRPPGGPAAAPPALDWLEGDVAMLRREYERQRARPMPENARWLTVGRVRVLEHRVSGSPEAAIVYFHGGGFIVGSPLTHADITAPLSVKSGLPLYSVGYRLAPDFIAPAPVEDGLAVIAHLVEAGTRNIVLCGDSAGGAVSLALEASLPDELRGSVAGVCSLYGAHGLFDTRSLLERGSRADGTDMASVRRYFTLANGSPVRNAYAIAEIAKPSPVPVYLLAAGEDPLMDDSLEMAGALLARGRVVATDIVEGEGHGFLHGAASSPRASDAMRRLATWIGEIVRNRSPA